MIENAVLLVRTLVHVLAFVVGLWPILLAWCAVSLLFAGCWSAWRSGPVGLRRGGQR